MSGSETIRVPGIVAAAEQPMEISGAHGDLTEELLTADVWSDRMVAAAGIPVVETPFVSVGGGIGSFIMVDTLRIAGVPASSIRVLGNLDTPWQTYEYLTRNSQIPREERLRSDSGSTPDNIWGFPSYAVREAWQDKSLAALWNVLTEPILTDYYTPRAGQAFTAMEKEAERIGYAECVVKGLVRMTRKREGGGYFTVLTPPAGTSATKRVAYRSRYVHVAVGYPGLRFLPDLQEYRQTYGDYSRVVNAYEPHEHVYEELKKRPSTVIVRGGGIVASRILQRLIDDRDQHGAQTQIAHLFRTYVDSSHGPSMWMRRKGKDGWAFQGFNWPKGSWGGQVKSRLEKLEGEERSRLYEVMGGTNTPHRKLWIRQLDRGRREGWYRTYVGEVDSVVPGSAGGTVTRIKTRDGLLEVEAAFIIDGTGLEADIREHRYLADLLDHSGVGRNVRGRLDVERSFEVRGTANGDGRMYASGSATLGGYYMGVDSFLGLQYAALAINDDLARHGFSRRIGPLRSTSQWLKWARGKRI
jgi:hypothetical protein